MIADLIDDKLDIRLITRNVMAVYSVNSEYTDSFLMKIKHSCYNVEGDRLSSDSFISYNRRTYNIYKNIYRFVKDSHEYDINKFTEYLNYFGLNHLLWMHFYQLDLHTLKLVEMLIQLSSNKSIVVLDYIDDYDFKDKFYSLLFHIGLDNRLIIVPFKNIADAVNNSTCQCYVKNNIAVKIKPKFSNEFINTEFNTSLEYYNGKRPRIYSPDNVAVVPTSYKYSLYELILIFLFSIRLLLLQFRIWRLQCQ